MKKILFFLLLLGAAGTAFAVNDTIWLNYKLDRVVAPWGDYYAICSPKEHDVFPVLIYTKDQNTLHGRGYVTDTAKFIKKNFFVLYGDGSLPLMEGGYLKNKKEGRWIEYYTGKGVFRKSWYKGDKKTGLDTMYYTNGIIKRVDLYEADTVKSGYCYDSSGRAVEYFRYETPPTYKGNLNMFLSKTLNYPVSAKENGIMGKVIMRFVVDTNGYFKDFKFVQTVNNDLDEEAKRVLLLSQPWTPGKREGKIVEMYFVQPTTFRLE